MSQNNDHVDFERLSDFADESLTAPERARVQEHVAWCSDCAVRLALLRQLLGAASALPAAVDPPADLWRGVHARIAGGHEDGAAAVGGRAGRGAALWIARRPWILAAAAVVLVAVSSAVTATIVRRPTVLVASAPAAPSAAPLLPAEVRAVEADYVRTATELAEALAAQRAKLDPATIAKVEASLRVIDAAIEEARRALASDPVNMTLLDILSANYQRKLELLRRATELSSSA